MLYHHYSAERLMTGKSMQAKVDISDYAGNPPLLPAGGGHKKGTSICKSL